MEWNITFFRASQLMHPSWFKPSFIHSKAAQMGRGTFPFVFKRSRLRFGTSLIMSIAKPCGLVGGWSSLLQRKCTLCLKEKKLLIELYIFSPYCRCCMRSPFFSALRGETSLPSLRRLVAAMRDEGGLYIHASINIYIWIYKYIINITQWVYIRTLGQVP